MEKDKTEKSKSKSKSPSSKPKFKGGFPKPGINKKGEPARKPEMKHLPLVKEQVKAILKQTWGNISRTADTLGCARQTVAIMINNDPELKEWHQHCRQRFVDELEQTSWQDAVETRDTTMRIFLLKTQARERGYDQETQNQADAIAKAAFNFVINNSKNPAES